jgi:hypothetical protein
MSQVEQMKMQLHGLADQSRQGAASLAGSSNDFNNPENRYKP